MNLGANLYKLVMTNAQYLVLVALVVMGVYFGFKREFSKMIGFLIVAAVAVLFVFNTAGVKDVLLQVANTIIGS